MEFGFSSYCKIFIKVVILRRGEIFSAFLINGRVGMVVRCLRHIEVYARVIEIERVIVREQLTDWVYRGRLL